MKQILLFLFFISPLSAKWVCGSNYDKMDNIHQNYCYTNSISSFRTLRGAPFLMLRFKNNDLDIYIGAEEYVGNVDTIDVKFDNDSKEMYEVISSDDNLALFINDVLDNKIVLDFANKILKHKKLLIRYYPYNENARTVEFNLNGLNDKFVNRLNKIIVEEQKRLKLERMEAEIAEKKRLELERIYAERVNIQQFDEQKKKLELEQLPHKEQVVRIMEERGTINEAICKDYGGLWEWNSSTGKFKCQMKRSDEEMKKLELEQLPHKEQVVRIMEERGTINEAICKDYGGLWEWNSSTGKFKCQMKRSDEEMKKLELEQLPHKEQVVRIMEERGTINEAICKDYGGLWEWNSSTGKFKCEMHWSIIK